MKSVEDVKNMRGQYIYLIREREFIRMDTQIYKVGKRSKNSSHIDQTLGLNTSKAMFLR
jgi:hypothetical protein